MDRAGSASARRFFNMEEIDDWLATRLLGRPRARETRQLEISCLRLSEALGPGGIYQRQDRLQTRSRLLQAGKPGPCPEVHLQLPYSWIPKSPPGTTASGSSRNVRNCGQRRCTPTLRLPDLDPQRAEWFYRKAQCEQSLGEKVAAQESLRSAIHLDPRNAKFHKALGKQLGRALRGGRRSRRWRTDCRSTSKTRIG